MLYLTPTDPEYDRVITKRPEAPFSAVFGIPPRPVVENLLGHLISATPLSMDALPPDEDEDMLDYEPSFRGPVLAPVPLQRSPRFCGRL